MKTTVDLNNYKKINNEQIHQLKLKAQARQDLIEQKESVAKTAVNKPVEAPAPAPVVNTPAPAPKPVVAAPTQPTGDAKAFIYAKESGNNPLAINASSGACGLGQALPCSKLLAACPVLADYACQDNWFTGYMTNRYGSWENARSFWLAHRWW